MKRFVTLGTAVAIVLSAVGCAVVPPQRQASAPVPQAGPRVEFGQVQSIDMVRAENQTSGGGALVGGLLGAVVGRQIGSGSGRTAGTVLGAVGGAVIGNQVEKTNRGAQDFYRVAIRTDHGQLRTFDYQQLSDLRVGDRVRVENNQVFRI